MRSNSIPGETGIVVCGVDGVVDEQLVEEARHKLQLNRFEIKTQAVDVSTLSRSRF